MNLRRLIGASVGVIALAVTGAACSDEDSVFDVAVGDCVESVSDLSGDVSELPDVACDDDHDGEVVHLFEHEGDDDDYPGSEALIAEAAEECEGDAFEDYTGTPIEETAIGIGYISPSPQSWGQGDRETICVASTGGTIDQSFEGNGDDFPGSGAVGAGSGGGEDTSADDFADLIDECEGGDEAACDELYLTTPVGSEAEAIGASCGGRSDTPIPGRCEATLG